MDSVFTPKLLQSILHFYKHEHHTLTYFRIIKINLRLIAHHIYLMDIVK